MPIVGRSRFAFGETVARLSEAARHGGATIFATIDQAQAASSVGLGLRPTTLIVFGNPRAGTGLMNATPLLALELPLKLLVYEDGGEVHVAYVAMSEIAGRYGIEGAGPVAAMDAALAALVATVAPSG